MALFAGLAVFVFARSLVPRLGEVLIAASAASAMRDQNALAGLGEVGDGFVGLLVVRNGANRNQQRHVVAGVASAVRTFAVAAAIGLEFAVVAVAQQRVVVGIGLEVDAAAAAAIAAGGSAARNVFFAAKRDAAVAAVTGFYVDFGFVNEHRKNPIRNVCGGASVEILGPPLADSG